MEDEKIESETRKWLKKLEEEIEHIEPAEDFKKQSKAILENIKAYISDCRHFLSKKDYLNAYEAAIYAWGMLEVALRIKFLVKHL
jgi:hypothetical protein